MASVQRAPLLQEWTMPQLLSILENEFQIVCLTFFLTVYGLRLIWLFSMRPPKRDLTARKGDPLKGILIAFATLAMPWRMESTRKHWPKYLEFAVFHIGLGLMILATVVIPYAPHLFAPPANAVVVVLMAAGLVAGLARLVKRFTRPDMRIISTRDDYFSLVMVNLLLFTCIFAVMGSTPGLLVFFALAGLLLLYVPFSKISHYLYWPFARFFYGYELGRRGLVK
jgi:nitrate reductase gamma subunit